MQIQHPHTTDGVPAGDIFGDANGFPDDFPALEAISGDEEVDEDTLPF